MGICFGKKGIPRRDSVDTSVLKNSRGLIIFMIGGPGTEKFTLGKKIAAKYGFHLISPSDMLRSEVDSGSERGHSFEKIMRQGQHIPADVIVQLVEEKMMTQPNAIGYLVVGFPRDKRQAITFNKEVKRPNLVLNLCARRLILTERMHGRAVNAAGNFNDTPEIIPKRIRIYFSTVAGAIEPNKKVTAVIDAEKEADEIFQSACAAVNQAKDTASQETN